MMAYRAAGVNIPRTSQQQWAQLPHVPAAKVLPGDLVFFAGADGTPTAPGHVGLVIGKNTMIEAYATGTPVRVSTFGTPQSPQGDGTVVGFAQPWPDKGGNGRFPAERFLADCANSSDISRGSASGMLACFLVTARMRGVTVGSRLRACLAGASVGHGGAARFWLPCGADGGRGCRGQCGQRRQGRGLVLGAVPPRQTGPVVALGDSYTAGALLPLDTPRGATRLPAVRQGVPGDRGALRSARRSPTWPARAPGSRT